MARVTLEPFIQSISGRVGDQVFRRYGDRIIVAKRPDRSQVEPSEAQIAHRLRFAAAAKYSKQVCADPELRAPYDKAANKTGKPATALMISDFMNEPTVEEIDLWEYAGSPGDVIRIHATDDFEVLAVMVVLTDADGEVIEVGEAENLLGARWAFVATEKVPPGTTVRVNVTVTDRPGATGALEAELTV